MSSLPLNPRFGAPVQVAGFLLRIAIGWHFLYEGVVKLLDPGWSAAGYLLQSRWFLSELFHAIAHHSTALALTNLLNSWALVLIGAAALALLAAFPAELRRGQSRRHRCRKPGNRPEGKCRLPRSAQGAFVQGNIADRFVMTGNPGFVGESIDYIRSRGVVAGTAAHSVETVRAVELSEAGPDFYMKTLHHTRYWSSRRQEQHAAVVDNADDNYWDLSPQSTVEYMSSIQRPWMA